MTMKQIMRQTVLLITVVTFLVNAASCSRKPVPESLAL